MHISEGVLSGPVLISGGVLAAAGTVIGLKKTAVFTGLVIVMATVVGMAYGSLS